MVTKKIRDLQFGEIRWICKRYTGPNGGCKYTKCPLSIKTYDGCWLKVCQSSPLSLKDEILEKEIKLLP